MSEPRKAIDQSFKDKLNKYLIAECKKGDFEKAVRILNIGADPLARGELGFTCLHYAAAAKNADMLARLFNAIPNCDVNNVLDEEGYTPLHIAALRDSVDVAIKLVELKADVNARGNEVNGGKTPLHVAAENGCSEVFNYLLIRAKANLWAKMTVELGSFVPFDLAMQEGHDNIQKSAIDYAKKNLGTIDQDNHTHLHFFSETNHVGAVKALLEAKADAKAVDIVGETCLHAAARGASVQIAKLLVEAGTDQKAINALEETAANIASESASSHPIAKYLNSLDEPEKRKNQNTEKREKQKAKTREAQPGLSSAEEGVAPLNPEAKKQAKKNKKHGRNIPLSVNQPGAPATTESSSVLAPLSPSATPTSNSSSKILSASSSVTIMSSLADSRDTMVASSTMSEGSVTNTSESSTFSFTALVEANKALLKPMSSSSSSVTSQPTPFSFADLISANQHLHNSDTSFAVLDEAEEKLDGLGLAAIIKESNSTDKWQLRIIQARNADSIIALDVTEKAKFLEAIFAEKVVKNFLVLSEIGVLTSWLPELKLKGQVVLSNMLLNIRKSSQLDLTSMRKNIISNILFHLIMRDTDSVSDNMKNFLISIGGQEAFDSLLQQIRKQTLRTDTLLLYAKNIEYELDGSIKDKADWSAEVDSEEDDDQLNAEPTRSLTKSLS
ncbi:MAG: ankyrin repeat domain-containing protein [Gammaproteobacteria bacterium]